MNKRKPLSKSEMEIVRVVWDLGKGSVRDVWNAMQESRKMDFTTVQTYLSRLAEKGYLKFKLVDRARVYSAKVQPRRVIGDTVEEFVGNLFGGEPLPLIRHLLNETEISPDQLSELRKLLDEAKGRSNDG